MTRIILILLAALGLAAPAHAYPVSPSSLTPAWLDRGDQPGPTTKTTADDPGAACPDRPASADPVASCSFDPTTYYLWQGDDADAPLWTRCNFTSGSDADPCPHSTLGDETWSLRCPDGTVWAVQDAETTDQGRADADGTCVGWVSLSVGGGEYVPITPTPPPASTCPDRPHSSAPNADCPLDPAAGVWPGDDADAPLSYRCNYDSGSEGDPCPHSTAGDVPWYFRCEAGDMKGQVGVEFAYAETDPAGRDDVTDNCGGAWTSLSVR